MSFQGGVCGSVKRPGAGMDCPTIDLTLRVRKGAGHPGAWEPARGVSAFLTRSVRSTVGPGYRRRRALVLLDRNHVHRPRNPPARGPGVGVTIDGVTAPTEIRLDAPLFVLDSSAVAVDARADGTNTPAAPARMVSRIVFDSPAGRSP